MWSGGGALHAWHRQFRRDTRPATINRKIKTGQTDRLASLPGLDELDSHVLEKVRVESGPFLEK